MALRHAGSRVCNPLLIVPFFLCPGVAFAQSDDQKEPAAVVEIGCAPSWSITGSGSSLGPTIAVEVTPIENWLELEAGVSQSFTVTRPNGIPTFCSRNPGPYPRR